MNVKLNYSFGQNTQLGKDKEFNTDAVLEFPIPNGHVFLVCDGHDGDEGHGALASKLTAESIKKYFFNKNYKDTLHALTNAVTFANFSVFEQAEKDPKYKNIGSTIAILIYRNGKVYYAYAGDSRIYLHKDGKLKALTLDHVDDKYNPAESEVNILLGKEKDIKFGVCKAPFQVAVNDRFVLCTDGLTDVVSNDEISEVVGDHNTSPDHKAMLLMQKVDENAGSGNASIQVIEFDDKHKVPRGSIKTKQIINIIAIVLGIGVIGIGAFLSYNYFSNRPSKSTTEAPKKIKKEIPIIDIPEPEEKAVPVVEDKKTETKDKVEASKPEAVKPESKPAIESKVVGDQFFYHQVQFGENLYRLSLRYGVSQEELKKINGSKAVNLIAGNSLKVPVRAVHVVKKGESYSVLSDKYNIKIDIICRANKLDRNQPLSEGEKVAIPFK